MRKGRSPSQRQLRVGETLRHILVDVISQGNLRDPALQGASITVSEVRVSPDLKNATAYVMPLGGRDSEEILAALRRASAYLRGAVAKGTQLRHAPKLVFERDHSFNRASEIDSLLQHPQVAKDLRDREEGDGS